MCSPTAAVVLTVVSAAASARGQYLEAKAANKAAEYNAKILEENAAVSDAQAADATDRGDVAGKKRRLDIRGLKGSQRSASAASGVLVDSGSTLDVLQDTDVLGEQDISTIRDNAALEAYGYSSQARDFRNQARLSRLGRRSTSTGPFTSLLTGAANASSIYAFSK